MLYSFNILLRIDTKENVNALYTIVLVQQVYVEKSWKIGEEQYPHHCIILYCIGSASLYCIGSACIYWCKIGEEQFPHHLNSLNLDSPRVGCLIQCWLLKGNTNIILLPKVWGNWKGKYTFNSRFDLSCWDQTFDQLWKRDTCISRAIDSRSDRMSPRFLVPSTFLSRATIHFPGPSF